MSKKNKSDENYFEKLQATFAHWHDVYENGCNDPTWPDGTNLNLIRNHIIYYKTKIEESMVSGNYPSVYNRPTPAEVNPGYVAKADEIRSMAVRVLELYRNDKNYQFIKNRHCCPAKG